MSEYDDSVSGRSDVSWAHSERMEMKQKRTTPKSCWGCGEETCYVVHVIGKEDRDVGYLGGRGLITFDLKSQANDVWLCPNCDVRFDHYKDPLFLFYPADLDFFIAFELRDRQRRRNAHEKGQMTSRRMPSEDDYRVHQEKQGVLPAGAVGGLYQPVYLEGLSWWPKEFEPRPWQGAPFAALRRAFRVLGSPRIGEIDGKVINKLQILRDLYYTDEDERVVLRPGVPLPQWWNGVDDDDSKTVSTLNLDEQYKEGGSGYEHSRKRARTEDVEIKRGGEPSLHRVGAENDERKYWSFGPGSTADKVVQDWSSMLAGGWHFG